MKDRQKNKSMVLKRMLSWMLTFVLVIAWMPQMSVEAKAAALSNPRKEEEFSMSARQKTTWDCIYFGHYPQSEITAAKNASLYYRLEQEYWGKGYVDLDGVRYYNVSGNTALLLSDVAFTGVEQAVIRNTAVKNKNNISYGTNGGKDTVDKVFLLSESETGETDGAAGYGFVKNQSTHDEAGSCKASAYATARGLSGSTSSDYAGNVYWWLLSARIIHSMLRMPTMAVLSLLAGLYVYTSLSRVDVSSAGDSNSIAAENIQMSLSIPKDATADMIVQKMNLSRLSE